MNILRERESQVENVTLCDLVLEVMHCHMCFASQLQKPAQVPGPMVRFWKICGTGNIALMNFGKCNLSQQTKEVDSTLKLIYKHTLVFSVTRPSCGLISWYPTDHTFRLLLTFLSLACMRRKSTESVENSEVLAI